jgi:hypothetical protein
MTELKRRLIKYLLLVECDRCGFECYPNEECAGDAADGYIDMYGAAQLSEMPFKSFVDRTCDYCEHVMNKCD